MHYCTVSLFGGTSPEVSELRCVMLNFHKPIPGTNAVNYAFVVVPYRESYIKVRNLKCLHVGNTVSIIVSTISTS